MSTSSAINGTPPPHHRGGPLGIYLTTGARDRDAILGYGSLFFASIGQATVWSPLIGHGVFSMFVVPLFLLPTFIIFFLNFTNRPPLSPQDTFRCWLFASCLYAVITILAEALYISGFLPITTVHHTSEDYYIPRVLHVVMHLGWLSFIPLIRYVRFQRANGHAL